MAILSVETKKISELEAATTLNANSLFVADMPTVGTQKLAYSDLVGNIKDSLQIPRAADAVATSAIATAYTNSQTQITAASLGYDLNDRLTVIERENDCINGVLTYGVELQLSDLLAYIRAGQFHKFAIGDYITVNSEKWCVAAKNYWQSGVVPNDAKHVILMSLNRLGDTGYKYNSTNTNSGGFNSSELKTTLTTTIYNALPSALRAACLDMYTYESTKSSNARYTRKIKLPNEKQVFGSSLFAPYLGASYQQLPLCRSLQFLGENNFWLLDPDNDTTTQFLYYNIGYQSIRPQNASSTAGVRPIITVG